ncbi:MAG TPA: hypothetical protein VKB88_06600 [Bryobacteraceae bacterium]|nr:hypothetical protein [Bryobacteraceae bacterium]
MRFFDMLVRLMSKGLQTMNRFGRWVTLAAIAGTGLLAAPQQSMAERVKPYLDLALASGNAFVSVSAASGTPAVAPGSLASIFGPNVATQTATGTAPYPTSLGGVSLQIVDGAGNSQPAELLYVSPTQINYFVPANTAAGNVTISLTNGTGNALSGTALVQPVAPALFTANGNGQGVVAATAYRTVISTALATPTAVFECGTVPGSCAGVPLDLGLDAPVTVMAYATGVLGRSDDAAVTVTIGSTTIPLTSTTSLDSASSLAGINLVTFELPLGLRGSGTVDIFLTVDGVSSNHAQIDIQ